jgi:polar amino acid transport system ATP-binding protein
MSGVEIRNIHKSFGTLKVLRGVSLNVAQGEVVALIGRSGSGKSTLLRCVNGLEAFDQGSIVVAGHTLSRDAKSLRALRSDVGIIFQSYNLFPHLSVLDNLMLAPRLVRRTPKQERVELAYEMLAMVGLSDKAASYPDELSGGQQQRVAIARSLAMRPKVMLFDEVTSALDPELTVEVLNTMEQLAKGGMTLLVVTHEMDFARRVAGRTVFMHDGIVNEEGPSQELFSNPRSEELKRFLASTFR